ncbi:MAG: heme exporter protein CcmD [Pseudomonadota bacterium]
MSSIEEFFAMGGYAAYVWPSYVFALLVLTLNIWLPIRRWRRMRAQGAVDILDPRVRAQQMETGG